MSTATVVAPLLLSAVLIFSGIAKLRDRRGVAVSFTEMRVPKVIDRPFVRTAFPWVEIGLGTLLAIIGGPAALLVAFATVVLFCAYLVLIWRAVKSPTPVACGCFGESLPTVVTQFTLLRNFTLLLVAVIAFFDAFQGWAPLARLYLTDAGDWLVAIVAVLWVGYTLFRDRLRPHPSVASPAPTVAEVHTGDELEDYERLPIPYGQFRTPDGRTVTLRDLARDKAVLLLWVSATCGSCVPVLEQIPSWSAELDRIDVRPVTLVEGSFAQDFPSIDGSELLDDGYATLHLFDASGTPTAVLLGADGLLAGGPVTGTQAVREFVEQIAAELRKEVGTEDGDSTAEPASRSGNSGGGVRSTEDAGQLNALSAEVRPGHPVPESLERRIRL